MEQKSLSAEKIPMQLKHRDKTPQISKYLLWT